MTGLLGGANYSMNQASYDLARLRVNGLITRIPGRNFYRLTGDGLRFAIFYTKVHDRLLRPLLAADQPPAPPPIRTPCAPLIFTSPNASTTPDCYPLQPKLKTTLKDPVNSAKHVACLRYSPDGPTSITLRCCHIQP
ncbi:hypothetical protein [Candidatus Mycobacterium methanotrophicum]|uniref:Uncharacterized protein n=1 Tax=Candidatus Mycobacterium methanotrophicum TaxID=2943498 RepID=A0ABY4QU91_9MYCO|nr:hypothetical protein [Candidatus Mycobacterium methanotrophicum]UQX13420.1 hypothetical protein M5I08_24750 [Candidatus Mycobacterium methanotrophicum]